MNPSVVLKTLLKPCLALTAVAGAMLLSSCFVPGPPPPPGPGPFPGPKRYGYGGTESPNYPPAVTKPNENPKIVRDPNNTTVDVTPPEPRNPTATNPPPTTTNPPAEAPLTTNPPEPTKPPPAVREDLPYGIPVVGKKGMVYSPFAPDKGVVDVDGYKRGTRVECPYTKKHFRVP